MTRHRPNHTRPGVAATEMALIAPILLILLVGVWEVCRVVMVQNIIDNAAREGGRMSASGSYFAGSNRTSPLGGTVTLPAPSTGSDYEVQKKVLAYLAAAGITTTGATVTVKNTGSTSNPKTWTGTYSQSGTGSNSGYDPAAAADQLDRIKVTVTLPYTNIGWSPANLFFSPSSTLTATADWTSMQDLPLTISTTIPTKPIQTSDPIP